MGDRLVRWGLPRAANAVPLLMEFVVVAVATVLSIRLALFITGYPQLGGNGLHIAHVLWGGLAMAVGVMGLLSFNGRVIRPVGAFIAGVGFGLFIDEVGKFLTSDNDYFFTPSIAIMYVVIVLLVLTIHAVHGRRPLSPRELYAAALTSAAAGVTNGMTDHSRKMALRRINAAGDLPGAPAAAALVQQIPRGRDERYDVSQAGSRVAARIARVLRTRPAMITTIVLLLIQAVSTLGIALLILSTFLAREAGANAVLVFDDPVPTAIGGASSIVAAACVVYGLVRLRQGRRVTGFRWMQRAVLIDLLLTRVFEFATYQFAAIPALVVDLLLLAALEFAIRDAVRAEAAVDDATAEAEEAGRWSPARTAATAGVAAALGTATAATTRSRSWPGPSVGAGSPALAGAASLDAGSALPSGVDDLGPGVYPGPVVASSGPAPGYAMPIAAPSPVGPPSGVVAEPSPAGQPLPAEPPALGGPASAPVVVPGAPAVGGPGPYFASLPVASASAGSGVGRAFGGARAFAAAGGSAGPDVPASSGSSDFGGCHSHGGVVGGAMAAGCGAFAGGLVAGMSTRSAAATSSGSAADADEIVGEVLDDGRSGDHDVVPTFDPVSDDDVGRSPRSVGGQPPAATWVGDRRSNAGSKRYEGPRESTVEDRSKVTPPPLS
ncbi:hypothetical protein SAMN05421812_111161 [Asanoa hainanensis]|uniref:Uncharacterized protein n=1 Tax=Asanoa hainanensis TaxID=560556 RepID=A0A239NYY5_9ACTN|nr:hypothetical protein [Asanoa hainanensis]SNT59329.1 hypothetical protein SAMN05421812_111161 [Asanoa hainanensis]